MANRAPRERPDVDSTRARRLRALGTASTVYSAAYGHPLEHDDLATAAVGIPFFRWTVRPAVAVVAVLVITALGGGVVVWSARAAPGDGVPLGIAVRTATGATATANGRAEAADVGAPTAGAGSGAGPGSLPTAGRAADVVVHVVGQVTRPGVVHLPTGARVADAIDAAGGATVDADLSVVNLARVLVDGEQVLVPRPGETGAALGPGPVVAADAPVDLNAATVADLDGLPGIGPVLAQRIVDWRAAHGRFTDVEELAEVSGIGPSVLSRLRDRVRV